MMIGKRYMIKGAGNAEVPIDTYLPQVSAEIDEHPRRRAIVVFPGGGYEFLSEREGEPIALMFAAAGFNAYVAYYRCAPSRFPVPMQDAAAAVAWVRAHADEHFTDPDKIAIIGFSAGGHLAGSLGTSWQKGEYWQGLALTPDDVRPNAMALCYPVITGGEYAHRGSFIALTGSEDIELHKRYSLEGLVSDKCPPTFLWHTFEDGCVPVQNSLLMSQALCAHGVINELHIFPHGGHGLSLCTEQTASVKPGCERQIYPYNAQWMDMAMHFMKECM